MRAAGNLTFTHIVSEEPTKLANRVVTSVCFRREHFDRNIASYCAISGNQFITARIPKEAAKVFDVARVGHGDIRIDRHVRRGHIIVTAAVTNCTAKITGDFGIIRVKVTIYHDVGKYKLLRAVFADDHAEVVDIKQIVCVAQRRDIAGKGAVRHRTVVRILETTKHRAAVVQATVTLTSIQNDLAFRRAVVHSQVVSVQTGSKCANPVDTHFLFICHLDHKVALEMAVLQVKLLCTPARIAADQSADIDVPDGLRHAQNITGHIAPRDFEGSTAATGITDQATSIITIHCRHIQSTGERAAGDRQIIAVGVTNDTTISAVGNVTTPERCWHRAIVYRQCTEIFLFPAV